MKKEKPYDVTIVDENGNMTIISSEDLFNPKLNPTLRLDAGFAIDLDKNLKSSRKIPKTWSKK